MNSPLIKANLTNPFKPDHLAIDLGWRKFGITDPKVFAPAAGRVISSEYLIRNGNCVVIRHPLNADFDLITLYYHLKERFLKTGDAVRFNQEIGVGGNTGTASKGPHLHFGTWIIPKNVDYNPGDGSRYAVDPRSLLNTASITGEGIMTFNMNESTFPTAMPKTSDLRYRVAPSLKAKILGTLPKVGHPYLGQTAEAIDGHKWAKIIVNDGIAYAAADFLAITEVKQQIDSTLSDGIVSVRVVSL